MSKFKVVYGCEVTNLEGIHEAYSIKQGERFSFFEINVSAERIAEVFSALADEVREPGFLMLEHGTHRTIEEQLRKSDNDPFHKDVYYIDGLTYKEVIEIFNEYKELLVNDGGSSFGFGARDGIDEVFVAKYKIFNIYTDDPVKYERKLASLGFTKEEKLKTVWDTFSPETPGACRTIEVNGLNIYGLVERLRDRGIYLAERRED